MTSPTSRRPDLPADDELDDILNGIVEGRDVPSTADSHAASRPQKSSNRTGDGLGIDEEIIVTKKRIPIPKLDEHRLLSDPGLHRLKRISKERLRFKGKGHEYGDIARMLNMYQLWLDDLYPRAKFADALTILEKVGHTKRMQLIRKDMIDDGKPRRTREDDEEEAVEDVPPETEAVEKRPTDTEGVGQNGSTEKGSMDGDTQAQDKPDDDELDALLAESEKPSAPTFAPRNTDRDEDPFADEMEAMEGMDW